MNKIDELVNKIKTSDNFITRFHREEIILSLTCNLSDDRTANFAINYFPNFYRRIETEYQTFYNSVKYANLTTHALIAGITLDMVRYARVLFTERMEKRENQ